MQRKVLRIMVVLSAIFISVAAAGSANAQTTKESRGRALTKAQVEAIVNRVEDRVDNFVKNLDRSLDQSPLNGTDKEDWLNKRAKDLEKATDELRKKFDRNDAWVENKDEVRRCLIIATDIERNMRRYNFGTTTESNWGRVRYELNSLADVYNIPRVGASVYN